jgi:hypothetical protein
MRHTCFFFLAMILLPVGVWAQSTLPNFKPITIDPDIGKVCYAVTLADVDGDGKQDIVAVSENRVLWYQNPTWQKRVIIEDQTPLDNVCIDAHDIDGDGKIDFALGAGWTKTGTIHWLSRGPSLDDRWTVHFIGEERSVHRMRFADVLGTGKPQLVLSPLLASVGNGVRLTALEIPADPIKDRWRPTVMDHSLNRMHNHWHVDLNGNGQLDTLTASREGIHQVSYQDKQWTSIKLGDGASADKLDMRGAGEIKTGRFKDGSFYLTTVEPMHGTMLAVYLPPTDGGTMWRRYVIDEGFQRGHALWTADINGDGNEEIIFGHSDTPGAFGVNVYGVDAKDSTKWIRRVVDSGGMATEDLVVGDLNGDGRPDIVAGGRSTRNVMLYLNAAD